MISYRQTAHIEEMRDRLSDLERDFKSTLDLILEDVEMLREERTEVDMESLCRNMERLKDEYYTAAQMEEEICRYDREVDRIVDEMRYIAHSGEI